MTTTNIEVDLDQDTQVLVNDIAGEWGMTAEEFMLSAIRDMLNRGTTRQVATTEDEYPVYVSRTLFDALERQAELRNRTMTELLWLALSALSRGR